MIFNENIVESKKYCIISHSENNVSIITKMCKCVGIKLRQKSHLILLSWPQLEQLFGAPLT